MNNNKTPAGSGGLTAKFYKVLWQDIKVSVVNGLNNGFHKVFIDLKSRDLLQDCQKKRLPLE